MIELQTTARGLLEQEGYTSTQLVKDEANKVYASHAHNEAKLFIVKGLMRLCQGEAEPKILVSGSHATIKEGKMHEVVIGYHGCTYWYGVNPTDLESWEAANS